ncbi:unnamed protein product [Gongylonema pulchrum]|uniref:Uncharacterized protein n=1 Tax=Gongylonema pulchrum TaxID=637853 RepID=A0A3P6SVP0_9BILA|nr:unnamed protein product [Gongylonema pulchrum]
MPDSLKRFLLAECFTDEQDESLSADYHATRASAGLGTGTSSYLASRLAEEVEFQKSIKNAKFNVGKPVELVKTEADVREMADYSSISKAQCILPSEMEQSDDEDVYEKIVELKIVRPTALCVRDETLMQIVSTFFFFC